MIGELKGWMVFSWIALPVVMYGGYTLLHLVAKDEDTEFKRAWFRVAHAHAGVLLLLSLLYYHYIDQTGLPGPLKQIACGVLVTGVLAQSGGFAIHRVKGVPGKASIGTTVTATGAILLATAIAILVFGLFTTAP
jgi:hypothetical protein